MRVSLCLCFLLLLFTHSFSQPKYEFRGAWIATVANIDWPNRGSYHPDQQKKEFIQLLDMHVRNGLNAVVVQVRPATDAFYPSELEPWSEWLTGKQGKAPSPYYDPLAFMIEETHKRGLAFHAWFNPYRAVFSAKTIVAPDHITRKRPDWFVNYGGKKYFDPGNREAQDFVVKVIEDVVTRYDIDAVHFDDYFYPYPVAGAPFPDNKTYKQHGDDLPRDDWRRSNVDSIIVKLGRAIKAINPICQFGISPFGVWRNQSMDSLGSATQAGVTNYDHLYADIRLWLEEGYIDYVVPQLYWEHGHRLVAYETLVEWWASNSFGKHCYIGLGVYKAGSNTRWRDRNIIPQQIADARKLEDVQGAVFFSSRSFLNNPNGWNDSLQQHYYKLPALLPPMHWLDSVAPKPPAIVQFHIANETQLKLTATHVETEKKLRKFALYFLDDDENTDVSDLTPLAIIPGKNVSDYSFDLTMLEHFGVKGKVLHVGVTSVDASNMESSISLLHTISFQNNKWIVEPDMPVPETASN